MGEDEACGCGLVTSFGLSVGRSVGCLGTPGPGDSKGDGVGSRHYSSRGSEVVGFCSCRLGFRSDAGRK